MAPKVPDDTLALAAVGTPRLLLRPEAAADALDISRAQLFRLLAANEIGSIKIGRSRRIPIEELRDWVAQQLNQEPA